MFQQIDVALALTKMGITYKESGDDYVIQCPYPENHSNHIDQHPSCRVDMVTGVSNCLSCSFSGTINDISKKVTGQSVYKLLGLSYSSNPIDFEYYQHKYKYKYKHINKNKSIFSNIIKTEGEIYSVYDNPDIMSFLKSIGVYTNAFIEQYGISYTPFSRFIAENIKLESGRKATAFYKRILFPVYIGDQLVNIEGRAYQKDVTPKTIYPRGGVTDYFYNWENINFNEPLVLVEGIKDFCKVWNVHKNTIALFGNQLTDFKIELLNKNIDNLILFMDNDKGGRDLADSLDEFYNKDFKIATPDKQNADPNDLTLKEIYNKLTNAECYPNWLLHDMEVITKVRVDW